LITLLIDFEHGLIDRFDFAPGQLPDPAEGILKNMPKNIQRCAFLMGPTIMRTVTYPTFLSRYAICGPRGYVKIATLHFHRLGVCWQAVLIAV
jgi:hypothetical protein